MKILSESGLGERKLALWRRQKRTKILNIISTFKCWNAFCQVLPRIVIFSTFVSSDGGEEWEMWSPGAPHLNWQPVSASRDYRGPIVGGGDQEFQVYMPDISEWCLCLLRWFVIAYSFVTLVVIMPIVGWSDGALPVSVLPVPPRPSGHISHRIRSLLRERLYNCTTINVALIRFCHHEMRDETFLDNEIVTQKEHKAYFWH